MKTLYYKIVNICLQLVVFFKEGPYRVLICHVTLIFYVTVIS